MIEIIEKKKCCGCNGCKSICPKKCIDMEVDNEGFWYPKVDKSRCINCNLCEKVCPFINNINENKREIKAYACNSINDSVRINSSSGGIFTLVAELILKNNGVVFGATYDNNFNVHHIFVEDIEEVYKFRGSKYVQSNIGNSYIKVKEFLDEGRYVLFSGTQCQIKGLNLFLKREYNNLITVDVICHGVPSPGVYQKYKDILEKRYNSGIKSINFREKSNGWKEFNFKVEFENGQKYISKSTEDVYMKGFLNNLYLRPSCYECKAKNFTSYSDISLADYWGVQSIHREIDDDKGTSLILVNSSKGKEILKQVMDNVKIIETDLEYAIKCNHSIITSVKYNDKRDRFFNKMNKGLNLETAINRYSKRTIIDKIKGRIKR